MLIFFCMLLMNGTACMIYGLYGTFGIFHLLAGVSFITIVSGMIPVIRKNKNIATHSGFMYWGVVGLYAAFAAEIFTRLPKIVVNADGSPNTVFYKFVGIGVSIVMLIGVYAFGRLWPRWRRL